MLDETELNGLCHGLVKPEVDESLVRDSLCEMTWKLVVNQSATVRSFAGLILNILASSGTE